MIQFEQLHDVADPVLRPATSELSLRDSASPFLLLEAALLISMEFRGLGTNLLRQVSPFLLDLHQLTIESIDLALLAARYRNAGRA